MKKTNLSNAMATGKASCKAFYVKPASKVYELEVESALLAGSGNGNTQELDELDDSNW